MHLKGNLLSATFEGVSPKNATTKPLSHLAACLFPTVDVITSILPSTFLSLKQIVESVVSQSFTPATCVTFALNHTQACAAFAFFIFGKIKIWAWSLHTVSKTGQGWCFSAAWLISAGHCKEGRSVGGCVCVSAIAVPKQRSGLSCGPAALKRGQQPEAFRSYPILTPLTFADILINCWNPPPWPPCFRLGHPPNRNSIRSSSALPILQPVEGLQKKMSPKLTNGSFKRSLKCHISAVV